MATNPLDFKRNFLLTQFKKDWEILSDLKLANPGKTAEPGDELWEAYEQILSDMEGIQTLVNELFGEDNFTNWYMENL